MLYIKLSTSSLSTEDDSEFMLHKYENIIKCITHQEPHYIEPIYTGFYMPIQHIESLCMSCDCVDTGSI